MTPTSEERRAVAERLREFADTDVWLSAMFAELEKFGDTDRPRADAIADLIDPTCEMVVKNGHACCGKCGHRLAGECEVEEDYYEFRPFCPDCGSRVVVDDDNE
jgi:DNA-directed RNA polymerase subunit RPC12/RpoP